LLGSSRSSTTLSRGSPGKEDDIQKREDREVEDQEESKKKEAIACVLEMGKEK
jgi:hypothetical protein